MKREIYAKMRSEGRSYQSIADEFGVTRQAVFSAISSGQRQSKPFEYAGTKKVEYPNVREWLRENHCSVRRLESMAGCALRTSLQDKCLTCEQIAKVCNVTGLPRCQFERV